jgi:hypothetical protein
MDLSSTVLRLSSGSYTVSRREVGSWTDGLYSPGDLSTLTVVASVQPLTGKQLQRLPEGLRAKELKAFITQTLLRTVSESEGTPADVVEVPGEGFYQIEKVEDWSQAGFYSCIGSLIHENAEGDLPPPGVVTSGDRLVSGNLTVEGWLLLGAFATGDLPTPPSAGALAYDTTLGSLVFWTGSSWVLGGGDVGAHIADPSGAHAASAISVTPSGNLAADDVQEALTELQSDVDTRATSSALTAHIDDTTAAHAASAVSNTPSGNLSATTVQAALNELQTEIDGLGGGGESLWEEKDSATLGPIDPAHVNTQITNDDADSRDNPSGLVIFRNEGLPNNPMFGMGNPYVAGVDLEAWGVWYKDDLLSDWQLILSGERSGTFAAVLDGVRRSSVEAFINNGDFKPWFRIEASSQAFNVGPGGALADTGDVVRSGGVLTITTQTEHKFGVGAQLWKTAKPNSGGAGQVADFGANGANWGPSGSTMVVASVVDPYTFTVTDARANATSTEPLIFSAETDVAFGRDEQGLAAVRVNGSSVATFNQYGIAVPGGLSVLATEAELPLGAEGVASVEVTADMLHILEGKQFYNEGSYRSTGWYNGGGETQTSQEVFVVGTGSGNKTTNLPAINGESWLVKRIRNNGQGGSNTLTIDPGGSDTINGASSLVLPAGAAVTLVANGTDWEVWWSSVPGIDSTLSSHLTDTSTHGVGEIVGTSESQTLSNKTFSDSPKAVSWDGAAGTAAKVKGNAADGASAVGVISDTANALSTAGAKLHSFRNNTTEKAYFDKDGGLVISGVSSSVQAADVSGWISASYNHTSYGKNVSIGECAGSGFPGVWLAIQRGSHGFTNYAFLYVHPDHIFNSPTDSIHFRLSNTNKVKLNTTGWNFLTSVTQLYTARSADTTLGEHHTVGMDASGATRTATLPTAVGCAGREYVLIKTDSSGNTVTLATTSSQTISGASSFSLASQYKYVRVVSDGTNWLVTGSN